MALTREQKTMYAELEHTFNTPGWQRLTKGWEEERDRLPEMAFFNSKSEEDRRAFLVRYGLLCELIALPSNIEEDKQAAEQEDE